jgi:hypothetical protein
MTEAPDRAWQRFNGAGERPLAIAAERERLGYIIAGLSEPGERSDFTKKAPQAAFCISY